MRWWPEPMAGEIVWCHFPDNIRPKPKARPALVLMTKQAEDACIFVNVVYGTSQKTQRLYKGEFLISQAQNPIAYRDAGLSFDTKFNFSNALELPFNTNYFSVPPHAPYGQIPKMGTLHPSMVRVAGAAYAAVSD